MSNLNFPEFRRVVTAAGWALEDKGVQPAEIRLTGPDMDLFRDCREILDQLTAPTAATADALRSPQPTTFMGLKVVDADKDEGSCVAGYNRGGRALEHISVPIA
ncbi:hypothetical protein OVA11_19260 [Caulobacter sp. SL161]|uniref:hypothetical protein n=1 Tax=Caulobacter sp. SL161 TaxID=2995156 RepID=UPI0022762A1E|nr:hypothetical protein [Caulobacter sp. SL161]MCY1649118.1 hypothetical protein [Caulobacter sp. SL161]